MFSGNQYFTLIPGYMVHNSVGSEIPIYRSTEDGYFYLVEDMDERYMYAPKKEELLRFELGEEFSEAVLAHILKFG